MRRVAAAISGNSGSTSTAAAQVLRARPAYLGLATKVISAEPASSIPLTPVISSSALPRSSAPSRLATSPSFIVGIVTEFAATLARLLRFGLRREELGLARLRPAPTPGGADQAHHLQRLNGLPGNVDTLSIRPGVRRGHQQACTSDQR